MADYLGINNGGLSINPSQDEITGSPFRLNNGGIYTGTDQITPSGPPFATVSNGGYLFVSPEEPTPEPVPNFIAVGDAVGSYSINYYSEDGITWNSEQISYPRRIGNMFDVTSNGESTFIEVGMGPMSTLVSARSTNGVLWQTLGSQIDYGYGRACIFNYSGIPYMFTSTGHFLQLSGTAWSVVGQVPGYSINGIAVSNSNIFVATTLSTRTIVISRDNGNSWSFFTFPSGTLYNPLSVTCSPSGRFVVCGSTQSGVGCVYTSTNLTEWPGRFFPQGDRIYSVACSPSGLFIALGAGGYTYYGTDGQNWETGSSVDNTVFTSIACDRNGLFCATGLSGRTILTRDCLTWYPGSNIPLSTVRNITGNKINK